MLKLQRNYDIIILGFVNPDMPELAIEGLQRALEHALPHSLAYVFTDASAKDYNLSVEVLPILQKKQITVSFLVTGNNTGDRSDPMEDVYYTIAEATDGQVFQVTKDTMKEALLKITEALDINFQTLTSINSDDGKQIEVPVAVDSSFSSLSVSLSGTNSKLSVKDRNDIEIKARDISDLPNMKFMTFDVKDSLYTIEARAESGFSLRVGGISELKFDFGFSIGKVSSQSETSFQPLINHKNNLIIFASNPELVKCLLTATLISANSSDLLEIPLIRVKTVKGVYISETDFHVPSQIFKIKITGYDKTGKSINRLISSGIKSFEGCES